MPSEVHCHKCNNLCSFREDQRIWRCLKYVSRNRAKKRKCNFSISDFHGTFLDNCHISPWKILLFINCWLHKRFTHSEIYHNLDFSPQSSINWRSYCSEVTLNYFENQPKIGGPGVIVEIDESKFGKSKYNRGRYVEGVWVFGCIERVSKKKFLFPLLEDPKRNSATLLPLIQRYVEPGSLIISDEWRAYSRLPSLGYQHQTVNHSANFVDPITGAHTQNIERLWLDVKSWVLKPGIRREYYNQYFSRYLFINTFKEGNQRLHHFLRQAATLYPHGKDFSRPYASSDFQELEDSE